MKHLILKNVHYKNIPARNVSVLCSAFWLPMLNSLLSHTQLCAFPAAQLSLFPAQLQVRTQVFV